MRWCLRQVRVDILGNLSKYNGNGIGNGNGNGIDNGNVIVNGKDDARKQWSDWLNDEK